MLESFGDMYMHRILVLSLANLLCISSSEQPATNQKEALDQDTVSSYTYNDDLSVPLVPDGSYSYGAKHRHPGYTSGPRHVDTLSWAVKIKREESFMLFCPSIDRKLEDSANKIAEEIGLLNEGRVGHIPDIYLFTHPHHHLVKTHHNYRHINRVTSMNNEDNSFHETITPTVTGSAELSNYANSILNQTGSWTNMNNEWNILFNVTIWNGIIHKVQKQLDSDISVEWYTRQSVRRRTKRSIEFNDPQYNLQWHLENRGVPGMDINVTGVWERGITGRNVVAVVVDDGLEWTVPDIQGNYNSKGSWDLNSNDDNPLPDTADEHNHHGTRCAGEIAAVANNEFCGVGVAYEAGIAGIRVLDGPMTDSLEATAFTKNFDVNDIYSCSWGPDDDGKTVDGPHHLANLALRHGVDFGRQGYGSIYVVASGNGGSSGDNCNYDGYANSIFTMTIGAVDETGHMPYYGEECASMLAVTFSSGSSLTRSIVTTDWQHHDGQGCTTRHTGTSAAAPLAAGMVALMLSARPCLTWRDIQHIIVITAVKIDIDLALWQRNAAGLHHSHQHGFGLMDAWRLVNAAKIWKPVPWMTVFTSKLQETNDHISARTTLLYSYDVRAEDLAGYNLYSLEFVQVRVTIEHTHRGDLQIQLFCPSNTHSILGSYRPKDDSKDGFHGWTFSTVRCWGEKPEGIYRIEVHDRGQEGMNRGVFISWQLKLFGSAVSFEDMQERMKQVKASYSGQYLNDSYEAPCPPPPENINMVAPLSERVLKILVLTGAFATFMAIYESIEYIFCYDNEKKEHAKRLSINKETQQLTTNRAESSESQSTTERQTLLHSMSSYDGDGEMIPLELLSASHSTASSLQNCASTSADLLHGTGLDERTALMANQNDPSMMDQALLNSKSSKHPNGKAKNTSRNSCDGDITGEISHNSSDARDMMSSVDLHTESLNNTTEYDDFVCSDDLLR